MWRPLALRWRRTRAARTAAAAQVQARDVAPAVNRHVHVHLAPWRFHTVRDATKERRQPVAAMHRLHSTVERFFLDGFTGARPAGAPAGRWSAAQRAHASGRSREANDQVPIARSFRRHRTRTSPSPGRPVWRPVAKTQAPIELGQTLDLRRRKPSATTGVDASFTSPAYGPLDIVWQRHMPTRQSEVGELPSQRNPQSSAAQVAAASSPLPVKPLRSQPPQRLLTADVDPRLLDRLTDDVIRRVERRVRIERERRGL
jgi:hypothetical protein